MKKQYQNPTVRFDSLHLRENIADKCWGWDASDFGGSIYFDPDGNSNTGYTEFKIMSFAGKCEDKDLVRRCKVIKSIGQDSISAEVLPLQKNNFIGCSTSLSS